MQQKETVLEYGMKLYHEYGFLILMQSGLGNSINN